MLKNKKQYLMSNAMFEEFKNAAMEVFCNLEQSYWIEYCNKENLQEYHERVEFSIKNAKNTPTKFMWIMTVFDHNERKLLIKRLSKTTKNVIKWGFEACGENNSYGFIYTQEDIDRMFN